jgi:hypothetical protein
MPGWVASLAEITRSSRGAANMLKRQTDNEMLENDR